MRFTVCVSCGNVQETIFSAPHAHQIAPHYQGEGLCPGSLQFADDRDLHESYEEAHAAEKREADMPLDEDLVEREELEDDPVDPEDDDFDEEDDDFDEDDFEDDDE